MIALARLRVGTRRAGKFAVLVAIGLAAVPIALAMLAASCIRDPR